MNTFVSVVIQSGTKFLSLRMVRDNSWRFAGGKPADGESDYAALTREAKEELGIDCVSLKYLGTVKVFVDGAMWEGRYYVCGTYLGVPSIQEPDKHAEMAWLKPEELRPSEWYVVKNYILHDIDAPEAAKVQALPTTNAESEDVFLNLCSQVTFDGKPLVSDKLKERLAARIDYGEKKYGSRLMTYNGRDVLLDMEQEAEDGIQYSHQGVMQGHRVAHIRNLFIQAAEAILELKRAEAAEKSK